MNAAEEFNRLVGEDPRAALEQAAWLREAFARAGILFGGVPMDTFLRPHLLERSEERALRADSRRLLELSARVARSAFGGDVHRLCAFLGTPEAEARWVRLDPGQPDVVLSRLDAFLTPAGPRFLEINSDAPAGFGYGDRMAEVFTALPLFQRFARGRSVSYSPSVPRLVEAVLGAWRRRGGSSPRVAIVDWADVPTRPDQEILRGAFEARGVACELADPRAMALRGNRLATESGPVDIVYRRAVLSEVVAREGEVGAFLEAYRLGLALFVNSFRCRLSEDKGLLALLTDESFAGLLGEEERAFVAARVPWTRLLREGRTRRGSREVDLIPYVLERREELVLKPTHGYGGQGVFLGNETPPADWERVVVSALGAAFVVQERVAIPEEIFPACAGGLLSFEALKVNVNPFYVAGADVGAVTRASRGSVINVSAGGGSVPTFVVS